jgi:hypothetical protein
MGAGVAAITQNNLKVLQGKAKASSLPPASPVPTNTTGCVAPG